MTVFKQGELVPKDGRYVKVDKDCRKINNSLKMKKGDKFPLVQDPDIGYMQY